MALALVAPTSAGFVAPTSAGLARAAPSVHMAADSVARKALWKPDEVAPAYLDGSLAGDAGFDPLILTALAKKSIPDILSGAWPTQNQRQIIMSNMSPEEQKASVAWMREAELKHARLAMLAAAGWPLAELLNPGTRAPSLFNGGLGDGPVPFFLVLAAGAAAYIEYVDEENAGKRFSLGRAEERIAGDFGFDPMGFSKEEGAYRRKELRANELFNGRLAMLAITGMAVQEFLWSKPVVAQTPFFFGR